MAEIPIQKKAGHNLWWLWLLILIVVLCVAWWLWATHGTRTTTAADSTAVTAPRADTTAPR